MDDSKNEGYAEGEEPLHFYYNREERLRNAPRIVQEYYAGRGPRPVKGLFKVLVATRANRLMLFSLVACLLLVLFTSLLGGSDNKKQFGNIQAELSSFSFEDIVYVSLRLSPKQVSGQKQQAHSENVKVEFWTVDVDKQKSQTQTMTEIYSGNECFLRTKFSDYDILQVLADVEIAGKKQTLAASVQRR